MKAMSSNELYTHIMPVQSCQGFWQLAADAHAVVLHHLDQKWCKGIDARG
jgi:hypothetical protein